jgi:hypothetical protein
MQTHMATIEFHVPFLMAWFQGEGACTNFPNATLCWDRDNCKGTKNWISDYCNLVFLALEGLIHSKSDSTP